MSTIPVSASDSFEGYLRSSIELDADDIEEDDGGEGEFDVGENVAAGLSDVVESVPLGS